MADSDAHNEQNDELRELLECPVCLETCCKSPIYMCTSGHHVCARCQASLAQCPTCRAPGRPAVRCITLEKIAVKVRLRCHSWRDGCKAMLNAEDMARHWVDCEPRHKVYPCCLCSRLVFGLSYPHFHRLKLADHVRKEHPGCFSEGECTQSQVPVPTDGSIYYFRLVSAHQDLFWVGVCNDTTDNKLYSLFTACIAGSEYKANNNYECDFKYGTADGGVKVRATVCVDHKSYLTIHQEMFDKCTTEGQFSLTTRIIRNL